MERWKNLNLSEQMANIGSEFNRTISWRKRGNVENERKAMIRTLELIDLTIMHYYQASHLKELTRLREVCCDYFVGADKYNSQAKQLTQYFLSFAKNLTR